MPAQAEPGESGGTSGAPGRVSALPASPRAPVGARGCVMRRKATGRPGAWSAVQVFALGRGPGAPEVAGPRLAAVVLELAHDAAGLLQRSADGLQPARPIVQRQPVLGQRESLHEVVVDLERVLAPEAMSLALGDGLAERGLRLQALRDVPGYLAEAPEPAALVVQRGEDDAGHEARAVLADPPALLLVAA